MKGWICVHRKMLDNPIVCKDSDHFSVWMFLLLEANHKEKEVVFGKEKISLLPGQLLTSRSQISKRFNISDSKVQRILSLFEGEQQIEQQTCNKKRLISVNNWCEYQIGEQQSEQQVNSKMDSKVNSKMDNVEKCLQSACELENPMLIDCKVNSKVNSKVNNKVNTNNKYSQLNIVKNKIYNACTCEENVHKSLMDEIFIYLEKACEIDENRMFKQEPMRDSFRKIADELNEEQIIRVVNSVLLHDKTIHNREFYILGTLYDISKNQTYLAN